MSFDAFEGNTISLKWENEIPTDQITVEYWQNLLDPHLTQNCVFAYSAYNVDGRYGDGGAPYEQANEFGISPMAGSFRFFKGTDNTNCDSEECKAPQKGNVGEWNHVALSWTANPENGRAANRKNIPWQAAIYINGELTFNTTKCDVGLCDMGNRLNWGGLLVLDRNRINLGETSTSTKVSLE